MLLLPGLEGPLGGLLVPQGMAQEQAEGRRKEAVVSISSRRRIPAGRCCFVSACTSRGHILLGKLETDSGLASPLATSCSGIMGVNRAALGHHQNGDGGIPGDLSPPWAALPGNEVSSKGAPFLTPSGCGHGHWWSAKDQQLWTEPCPAVTFFLNPLRGVKQLGGSPESSEGCT